MIKKIKIAQGFEDQRLDKYLKKLFSNLTQSFIEKNLRSGKIKINKKKYSLHWLDIWKKIRLNRWDIICDLRSTPIIWFVKAKKRIVLRSSGDALHRIKRLAKLNPSGKMPIPKVWIGDQSMLIAEKYLNNDSGPFIAIGPTANWPAKVWSTENFAALIRKILDFKDLKGSRAVSYTHLTLPTILLV